MTEIDDSNTIILRIENESFQMDKAKLSSKSLYFNSLFSGNFQDASKKEFDVTYEIGVETFKSFLVWIDNEEPVSNIFGRYYNSSLTKYESTNFEELLELLRTAVFFAADNLLTSLSYILINFWFKVDHLLDLWTLAQELSVKELELAAFAACLDRFEELPKTALLNLPIHSFEKLVNNINLRCSRTYLESLFAEWAQLKNISQEKVYYLRTKNSTRNDISKFLQCTAAFRLNPYAEEDTLIYTWNGSNLDDIPEIVNGIKPYSLTGSQILGRGYSIYVLGGERVIGRGSYNLDVMRYCCLTQKWYRVTRLPEARRHFVAAFIGNKLVIAGGVGTFRVKLNSVRIFNVHTETWTKGATVPEEFTENPPACVFRNKMIIGIAKIYCYDLQSNWQTILFTNSKTIDNIACCHDRLYVFFQKSDESSIVQIYMLEEKEIPENNIILSLTQEVIVGSYYNVISIDNHLVFFIIYDDVMDVEVGTFESRFFYKALKIKTHERNDVRFKFHIGCFNILNPSALFIERDDGKLSS